MLDLHLLRLILIASIIIIISFRAMLLHSREKINLWEDMGSSSERNKLETYTEQTKVEQVFAFDLKPVLGTPRFEIVKPFAEKVHVTKLWDD